jgi:hypothetical protein
VEKVRLQIDENEVDRLAQILWEEEDRMLPDMAQRTWADLDDGDWGFYRNCVTAVLREATDLRII